MSYGFYARSGAYIKAGGKAPPKSWVGAYVGGARHKATFRHPVYPSTSGVGNNADRKSWTWADQPTRDILTETWEEMRTVALAQSDVAIQRAVDKAFGHEGL